jgi:hypothetical protein
MKRQIVHDENSEAKTPRMSYDLDETLASYVQQELENPSNIDAEFITAMFGSEVLNENATTSAADPIPWDDTLPPSHGVIVPTFEATFTQLNEQQPEIIYFSQPCSNFEQVCDNNAPLSLQENDLPTTTSEVANNILREHSYASVKPLPVLDSSLDLFEIEVSESNSPAVVSVDPQALLCHATPHASHQQPIEVIIIDDDEPIQVPTEIEIISIDEELTLIEQEIDAMEFLYAEDMKALEENLLISGAGIKNTQQNEAFLASLQDNIRKNKIKKLRIENQIKERNHISSLASNVKNISKKSLQKFNEAEKKNQQKKPKNVTSQQNRNDQQAAGPSNAVRKNNRVTYVDNENVCANIRQNFNKTKHLKITSSEKSEAFSGNVQRHKLRVQLKDITNGTDFASAFDEIASVIHESELIK